MLDLAVTNTNGISRELWGMVNVSKECSQLNALFEMVLVSPAISAPVDRVQYQWATYAASPCANDRSVIIGACLSDLQQESPVYRLW